MSGALAEVDKVLSNPCLGNVLLLCLLIWLRVLSGDGRVVDEVHLNVDMKDDMFGCTGT